MQPDGSETVAALCHGVAGFLPAGDPDGAWLFRGRRTDEEERLATRTAGHRMTAFTDEEERLAGKPPWLLETRLRAAGAILEPRTSSSTAT